MTDNEVSIRLVAAKYYEVSKMEAALAAKKKELQKQLLEAMKKDGKKSYLCENIGTVEVVTQTRKTLQAKVVEEKFNIKLTDDCYKVSTSEYAKVLPLIVEGKEEDK